MNNPETICDIIREMRAHDEPGRLVFGQEVGRLADRIEAAWKRERVAIEADALNAGALLEAFRRNDEKKFDQDEFDKSVSGPSAWDSVKDPVAEIRKMRGEREDAK